MLGFFFGAGKWEGECGTPPPNRRRPSLPSLATPTTTITSGTLEGLFLISFSSILTTHSSLSQEGRKKRNGIFSWLGKNHYSFFSETRLIFLLLLTSRRIRGRATLIPNPLYYLLLQNNNTFRPKKVPPLRLFFPIQRNCSLKNTVPGKIEKVFTRST